ETRGEQYGLGDWQDSRVGDRGFPAEAWPCAGERLALQDVADLLAERQAADEEGNLGILGIVGPGRPVQIHQWIAEYGVRRSPQPSRMGVGCHEFSQDAITPWPHTGKYDTRAH